MRTVSDETIKEFETKINEICKVIHGIANNVISDNQASELLTYIIDSLSNYDELYHDFKDFMKDTINRNISYSKFIAGSVNMCLQENKVNAYVKLFSELEGIDENVKKNIPDNSLAVFIGRDKSKNRDGMVLH